MKRRWFSLIPLSGVCLLFSAAPVLANLDVPANFAIDLDARGRMSIYFLIPTLPQNPSDVTGVIARAVRSDLTEIDLDVEEGKKVVTLMAKSGRHFQSGLFGVGGEIQLEPVITFLREMQLKNFELRVRHPRAEYSWVSLGKRTTADRSAEVEYLIEGNTDYQPPGRIEFHFGYHPSTVIERASAAGVVFLLLLVLALSARKPLPDAAGTAEIGNDPAASAWLGIGLAWAATVLCLKLDWISSFAVNADLLLGKFLVAGVLMAAPPLAIDWSVALRRVRQKRDSPRWVGRMVERTFAWLVPALLWVAAATEWRQLDFGEARPWLFAAVAASVITGFLWTAMRWRPRQTGDDVWPEVRRLFRRKYIIETVATLVVLSAFLATVIVFTTRDLQVDEANRGWVYLGGLVAVLVILHLTSDQLESWVMREWRQTAEALAKRNPRTPIENSPAQPGEVSDQVDLTPPWAAASASVLWRFGSCLAALVLTSLTAVAASYLLDLRFDLTHGNEGWAVLILAAVPATIIFVARKGGKIATAMGPPPEHPLP